MRSHGWIVFIFVFVLALSACTGALSPSTGSSTPSASASAGSTLRIGAIYNLTGAQASLDGPSANGAKLAVKEINEAGGVLGRQLELVLADGRTDPAAISPIAIRMVSADKVLAMIGFSDTDQVLAAAPIAAEGKVVFVTSGATSPQLPAQVPDWLFLVCFGDNVQAAAGAEYAWNTLQAKTCYLLMDRQMEFTTLLGRYFQQRFTGLGGTIVLEGTYQTGDKDFSAPIAKLKALASPPDLLYIASGPDEVGTIVQQFRQAGLSQPILGGDSFDTPLLLQTAGVGTEDVFFTTHALMDPQSGTEAVKKFIAAYRSAYGISPENAFAALGYDAVKLVADAIRRAGKADAAAIRDALQATQGLAGVTGTITYQPGSRIPQKGVTVVRVKDGVFTLAAEVTPQQVPAP